MKTSWRKHLSWGNSDISGCGMLVSAAQTPLMIQEIWWDEECGDREVWG